ncbi:hypothetical protein NDU88_001317 [Pleurodeles waltl]|uniref:Uncharacterized protein n=1 Tax=Pleurodeles waltl TaxID=8319 RepID=A0AAV7NFD3_PLEWA|nr:hypothetical protein NDU88_001317 [Pleurodeles waltl]
MSHAVRGPLHGVSDTPRSVWRLILGPRLHTPWGGRVPTRVARAGPAGDLGVKGCRTGRLYCSGPPADTTGRTAPHPLPVCRPHDPDPAPGLGAPRRSSRTTAAWARALRPDSKHSV